MCGIVGAVSQRNVAYILLESLSRLEYRGYDSAGIAIVGADGNLQRLRRIGKVSELSDAVDQYPVPGTIGIAHTRWATHGKPNECNAHPHISGEDIAIVHNGIIGNYKFLRNFLQTEGYIFTSDTDTEVIAHLVNHQLKSADSSLLIAVQKIVKKLEGAYSMTVMDRRDPDRLVVVRSGSPLVIGLGLGENFIASDQLALLSVTRRFIVLEEGDVAEISRIFVTIFNIHGKNVSRAVKENNIEYNTDNKGQYPYYMLKEIYEQPDAIAHTLEGCLGQTHLNSDIFKEDDIKILKKTKSIQIVACGTSYHAGMVARYWFEGLTNIHCCVDIASEFRYHTFCVPENCLFVTLSQSGETADTLAALQKAKALSYIASLTICNVPGSSIVRDSDIALMTLVGPEIGVAATKTFTAQLVTLLILVTVIGRYIGMNRKEEAKIVQALKDLPNLIRDILNMSTNIKNIAADFADKHHSIFLGRGPQYPIAMEGALKLKEISYIHAEAYAAGELKHGPLALIDNNIPVVVIAPNNNLLEKVQCNIETIRARGGQVFVFSDKHTKLVEDKSIKVILVGVSSEIIAPILYAIPLQLLSYHVAIIKGTNIDQPRHLAKSVTVE